MGLYTIRTASDLSTHLGKFVRRNATSELLEVNVAAGSRSVGVLFRIYALGAVQYGEVMSGQDFGQVLAGGAFAADTLLTNDAQGRAVAAVGQDSVGAVAVQAATGAGSRAYAQSFSLLQSGPNVLPPSNPTYFVSSTGSDALSQAGTLAAPLATPQEASRRLGATLWLGVATVVTLNALNLGASPSWCVPSPVGNAYPVVFDNTLQTDIAAVAPTGGTLAVFAGVVAATFTSANGAAANSQRGKILEVTAGPNLTGARAIIHSNDGAGGFTVGGQLAGVPVAANLFDVKSRVGSWTWSGKLTLEAPGHVFLNSLSMLPTGAAAMFSVTGGIGVEYGCLWTSSAAGFCIVADKGGWLSGGESFGLNFAGIITPNNSIPTPPSLTVCGSRYDGTLGAITIGCSASAGGPVAMSTYSVQRSSGESVDAVPISQAGNGTFFLGGYSFWVNSGVVVTTGSYVQIFLLRLTNGRPGALSIGGVVCVENLGRLNLGGANFPTAAADIVLVTTNGHAVLGSVAGAPSGAGNLAINVQTGGLASIGAGVTCTGGTVGTDVKVDGGVAMSIANASSIREVGSSNGNFQHSSDSSGTPGAAVINKLMGISAFAAGTGAAGIVITNGTVNLGDNIQCTPIGADATGGAIGATAANGSFTAQTALNATGIYAFQWKVTKATV